MSEHNELGALGERLARQKKIEKGYKILEQNYIIAHKEIDIIAQDGEEIVIVEVRARRYSYLIEPEETVTRSKQSYLIFAADAYVRRHNLDVDVRFDIVAIIIDREGRYKITHTQDAFYPVSNRGIR